VVLEQGLEFSADAGLCRLCSVPSQLARLNVQLELLDKLPRNTAL
jgi:hypothetical protein